MREKGPSWKVALLVAGLGIFWSAAGVRSADDEKELADKVRQIGAMIEKGKLAEAKKEAQALAKNIDIAEFMNVFRIRKKDGSGGIGVGLKPGLAKPDGIESYLQKMEKRSPANLAKEADLLMDMSYVTAAAALVTFHSPPEADKGKKKKKDWLKWSQDQYDAAIELAKAAKAKDGAAIKKAGKKLDNSCTACHDVFKE